MGIKIKLRSFKISEHIYEKGDGPYRGFGYLSLFKYKVEQIIFPNMTHWPVKYCPGRFLVYSSDIIKDPLAAVSFTPFLWLDDVNVTGLLASKVGNVKHLLFQDVSKLIEWLENAKTAQFLKAWNRFLQL